MGVEILFCISHGVILILLILVIIYIVDFGQISYNWNSYYLIAIKQYINLFV